jgi:hypothetical protein
VESSTFPVREEIANRTARHARAMDRIESKLRTSSPEYQENFAYNRELAEDLIKRLEQARRG